MSRANVFALRNSGLNPFLFAEVGVELNGSPLTILSVLARLGQDPWALAALWVKLPKALTIDRLTQSIAQMPLCPRSLAEAPITAARLVLLLPTQTEALPRGPELPSGSWQMPQWVQLAIFGCVVLFVLAAGLVSTPNPRISAAAQSTHTVVRSE